MGTNDEFPVRCTAIAKPQKEIRKRYTSIKVAALEK